MSKDSKQPEWSFNLNSLSSKENLKEPLGYKSSITDISVRASSRKSTQVEVLENKAWEFAKSPSK